MGAGALLSPDMLAIAGAEALSSDIVSSVGAGALLLSGMLALAGAGALLTGAAAGESAVGAVAVLGVLA